MEPKTYQHVGCNCIEELKADLLVQITERTNSKNWLVFQEVSDVRRVNQSLLLLEGSEPVAAVVGYDTFSYPLSRIKKDKTLADPKTAQATLLHKFCPHCGTKLLP